MRDGSSVKARKSTKWGWKYWTAFKRVASGEPTKSEELGHTEFIMTYKSFEPIGPGVSACLSGET